MHLLSSLGGGGKNFRKVFVCVWGGGRGAGGVRNFYFGGGWGNFVGGGGRGGGSCNFEVKLCIIPV